MQYISILLVCILMSFNMFHTSLGLAMLFMLIGLNIIISLSKSRKFMKEIKFKKKIRLGYLFLFFWILYAFIQVIFATKAPQTFNHLQTLIVGIVLIFFISTLIKDAKDLEVLYKAWGFAVLLTVLVGWWEILTNNHLPQSGAGFYEYEHVATAGFYNPNDFAFYLVVSMPVLLYWLKQKTIYKFTGFFMLVSSFYFIYANEARFIVALFFGVLVFYFFKLMKERKIKLVLFFTIVGFVVYYYFQEAITIAFASILELNSGDESVGVRGYLTDKAIGVFEQNIFGVGPGNAELYMPRIGTGSSIHNFWLEILVNYGFLIFIGLVSIFIYSIFSYIRVRETRVKSKITPVLWSIIIFIPACVQSSSIFSFGITWFFLGALMVSINVVHIEREKITNQLV